MAFLIVHPHLADGGVSQVIRTTSHALRQAGIEHLILIGRPTDQDDELPIRVIPGLDYLPQGNGEDFAELLESLQRVAAEVKRPIVWHFHNPCLGLNPRIPRVIQALAVSGERLILQHHDLAEDGRFANYEKLRNFAGLYPVAPRIRHAFVNTTDRDRFVEAGLPISQAAWLPNPVDPVPLAPADPHASPLVLVPLRAIRRKNLGEILLLAALAPHGCRFALTRAPENPRWKANYDAWRSFSQGRHLPVTFGVVDHLPPCPDASADFKTWCQHATHVLTTSIAEGFGLIFLEAIAIGRPLIGRNLPAVTRDHQSLGLKPGTLYDRILIPRSWVATEALETALDEAFQGIRALHLGPAFQDYERQTRKAFQQTDFYDFGNLPEAIQASILDRVIDSGADDLLFDFAGHLLPAHDALHLLLNSRSPLSSPESLAPVSSAQSLKRLIVLHDSLLHSPVAQPDFLDLSRVLSRYLQPGAFRFLLHETSVTSQTTMNLVETQAVIFDVHGTLLFGAGPMREDPEADVRLFGVLRAHGLSCPNSPTAWLVQRIRQHHQQSSQPFPEIDLRALWSELLGISADDALVTALERARQPVTVAEGLAQVIATLHSSQIRIGLLSNAQCDTLPTLHAALGKEFPVSSDLCLLSYQHGMAKPSPQLFETLIDRLAAHGIDPASAVFVGNDPIQDILPAKAVGLRTALVVAEPSALRPGPQDLADHFLTSLRELPAILGL